jgi:hypothetical protein
MLGSYQVGSVDIVNMVASHARACTRHACARARAWFPLPVGAVILAVRRPGAGWGVAVGARWVL